MRCVLHHNGAEDAGTRNPLRHYAMSNSAYLRRN